MAYWADFKLSVTRALSDQMAAALESLAPAKLTAESLSELDDRSGVYLLYKDYDLVYVGKAARSLPQRLDRHRSKLTGRLNINMEQVRFTCLYVDEDLDALAPETMLISRFRAEGRAPWNFSGFGSNDPGRHRDATLYETDHFDVLYPVDLDVPLVGLAPGRYTGAEVVTRVKSLLPYLFRYAAKAKRPHVDLTQVTIELDEADPPADRVFALLADALPDWQITALPGYVIMYREQQSYPSARRTYRHKPALPEPQRGDQV
jgi:hypothetical protein